MTSPVQPPGGSGPPKGPDDLEGAGAEKEFAEALEKADSGSSATAEVGGSSVNAVAGAENAPAAGAIDTGRETLPVRAEELLEQALSSDLAMALDLDARKELASFLSEKLAEDPHLQALLAKLEAK